MMTLLPHNLPNHSQVHQLAILIERVVWQCSDCVVAQYTVRVSDHGSDKVGERTGTG